MPLKTRANKLHTESQPLLEQKSLFCQHKHCHYSHRAKPTSSFSPLKKNAGWEGEKTMDNQTQPRCCIQSPGTAKEIPDICKRRRWVGGGGGKIRFNLPQGWQLWVKALMHEPLWPLLYHSPVNQSLRLSFNEDRQSTEMRQEEQWKGWEVPGLDHLHLFTNPPENISSNFYYT